jgi:hypothetical protein
LDAREFAGSKVHIQVWENKGIKFFSGDGGELPTLEQWKNSRNLETTDSLSIATANLTPGEEWEIFLPKQINVTYNVGWKETELNILGNAVKSVENAAKGLLPGGIADAAIDSVKLLNREALNPFSELMFENVQRRSYNVSFDLIPKNPDESVIIVDFVKFLKTNMTPAISPNTGTLVLTYPNYFKVRYLKNGLDNPFMVQRAYSVLSSLNVDYMSVPGIRRDGSPFMVRVDATFTEIEPIFRQMAERGY